MTIINSTATTKVTTLRRRRPTKVHTIVLIIAGVILLPFFCAAMVGCADAATSKPAKIATYNDGWIDASQNMIDQYKISRQGVDTCLAGDKSGTALIRCIDAIRKPNAQELQELKEATETSGKNADCHLEWDGTANDQNDWYEAICR
jgi:hypothetical protein